MVHVSTPTPAVCPSSSALCPSLWLWSAYESALGGDWASFPAWSREADWVVVFQGLVLLNGDGLGEQLSVVVTEACCSRTQVEHHSRERLPATALFPERPELPAAGRGPVSRVLYRRRVCCEVQRCPHSRGEVGGRLQQGAFPSAECSRTLCEGSTVPASFCSGTGKARLCTWQV